MADHEQQVSILRGLTKVAVGGGALLTVGGLLALSIASAAPVLFTLTAAQAAVAGVVNSMLPNFLSDASKLCAERVIKFLFSNGQSVNEQSLAQGIDDQLQANPELRQQVLDNILIDLDQLLANNEQLLTNSTGLRDEVANLHLSVGFSYEQLRQQLTDLGVGNTPHASAVLSRLNTLNAQLASITVNTNRLPGMAKQLDEIRDATVSKQITSAQVQQARIHYLAHVVEANGRIDPRGILQTNRQVLLDMADVYVNLTAERDYNPTEADHRTRLEQELVAQADLSEVDREQRLDDLTTRHEFARPTRVQAKLDQVVREQQQLVVLGDPGSGKTTLLRYLAYQHATALQDNQLTAGEQGALGRTHLPIYIRIAEYAEAKVNNAAVSQRPLRDYLATNQVFHSLRWYPTFRPQRRLA